MIANSPDTRPRRSYRRPDSWTPAQDEIVRQNYLTMTDAEVGKLIGRSSAGIATRRSVLGLRRTNEEAVKDYSPNDFGTAGYIPSPEQIETAKAEIRQRWSKQETEKRIADDRYRPGEVTIRSERMVVGDRLSSDDY